VTATSKPHRRRILPADPKASYEAHREAVCAAIERVLQSGNYILGDEVETFEQEFSRFQSGGYTVGVANGTEAVELALRAVGVKAGDRVATVANTVTATVTAIVEMGAEPRYVDVDRATMTMCPDALQVLLQREKVAAILPVHLYGQPAAIEDLVALARAHDAVVVEDCAQAHGGLVAGRRVGTFGDAAAFSFYPTKNLGALGDGGAVYTQRAEVHERLRSLRQYGWRQRYVAESDGRNSRLDELQAAILRAKLPHLDSENDQRRAHARRLSQALAPLRLELPQFDPGAVFHQYAVRTPERDALRRHLEEEQIVAGVLYPVPIHHQPAFRQPDCHLPETERCCAQVLCLPIHPHLTVDDLDRVIAACQSAAVLLSRQT
jgi:dTDP-3-amino-2,3,6-trideoxy-4-keto-D-glucose/dTDP-3-amino-3,4,6-trideoxy-alpha-D-glucose/dTDP-2,6-dideoxy-D-kanosamine transaminase